MKKKRLLAIGAVAVAAIIAAGGFYLRNRDIPACERMTQLTAEAIAQISFGEYVFDEEPSQRQYVLSAGETAQVLAAFSSLEKGDFRRVSLRGMTVPAKYYLYITLTEGGQLILNGTRGESTYGLIYHAAPQQGKASYYLVEIPRLAPLFDALSRAV